MAENNQQEPTIALKASDTSRERPWPVSMLAQNLKMHIEKAPYCWVEGEVIEYNQRATASYITLRDLDQEVSFSVQAWAQVTNSLPTKLERGSRVTTLVKPSYWLKTGRLSMQAREIHPVGIGDLLARIELLRKSLAEEGLFDQNRKKALPFLPQKIGVITGRNSDAGKDILRNATLRWSGVSFEFREVATQGAQSVSEVTAALAELDEDSTIDIIVIARGGGSVEDLMPFSDEGLIRAVAKAKTPVVSAIGHEADNPILDNVADLRASTPTDAAKTIVPDVQEEIRLIQGTIQYLQRFLRQFLDRENERLSYARALPILKNPYTFIDTKLTEIASTKELLRSRFNDYLWQETMQLESSSTQLKTLSPQSTLDRGYAVVRSTSGKLITEAQQVHPQEKLNITVSQGNFSVTTQT